MTADPQNLIFGKYALIRRLALGGMGEVFLARQTGSVSGTERLVILKSLLPELAEQDGFVDQFLDEARVAAKLNHPNVVQMFEAGLWNGMYFIAMEYIRGDNLARIQKIAKSKGLPFPIHIIVRIARDALLGLGHAHTAIDDQTGVALSVVHRDVSPQNIMVRVDGVTKVVDFGIAKAGNRSSRTATGVLKGKLQFMSPEQVKGEEVDARADQFAMGIVLWELLTSKRLFGGDNEIQTLKAVLQQRVTPPSELVDGMPLELEVILMKMLERDPAARYPSCADAAEELSHWLALASRRVSEADVAVFIKAVVGENIDEQTRNLSPSENFVMQLHHTPAAGSRGEAAANDGVVAETSNTVVRKAELTQARKVVGAGVGLGALAAVALAVGMAVVVVGSADETVASRGDAGTQMAGAAPPQKPIEIRVGPPPRKVVRKGNTIEIELADPVGAAIVVDGHSWPQPVPTTLILTAGAHKIAVIDETGASLEVPVVMGLPVVSINSDPPGASVIVAGSSFGMTPARITKLSGGATHELTLKKDGYLIKKVLIEDLQDGEERSLLVSLEKAAKGTSTRTTTGTTAEAPPASTKPSSTEAGTLVVNTTPGSSKVFLDGDFVGTTPFYLAKVPAGAHVVVLENVENGQRRTKPITIGPGAKVKIAESWN